MPRDDRGFSLVEAAVAIAVTAILAGMMAPLALKVLDQRREAATRRSLKAAFEALFGLRDRRVANLRADCGFNPPNGTWTLGLMVDRTYQEAHQLSIGFTPAFGPQYGTAFRWGWNGPYWRGDLRGRLPVDAWGSPIQLRVVNGAVQVYSPGPSRRDSPDSLTYPSTPLPLASLEACVNIHLTVASEGVRSAMADVAYGNTAALPNRTTPFAVEAGTPVTRTVCVPAGGLEVGARYQRNNGPFQTFSLPLDLLPGEIRDVWVNL
ncbi:prepilin-type N-terminal cleavage/methylation domain-containing protein [Mesoterricola silvestris]|uniref:Prepilin-type N-terminal cleavage/methylation domain-containing protein n=1 Tax=Mesoterricola silvestris TaxID=2927979 RepID=A0AA48GJD3_9BACT|nr:prepilin-type N-terminal cleavage/methylation domain-containing protein [Mesoterricola silvestris]BDU72204.1 hypothetical protein METEAL_13780 [Mesoterricola silvestris]